MGCIKRCFSRNTPLLLLQKRTVDRAIYHLNQSRWNQYLVCDRADDNLYKKMINQSVIIIAKEAYTELTIYNFNATKALSIIKCQKYDQNDC